MITENIFVVPGGSTWQSAPKDGLQIMMQLLAEAGNKVLWINPVADATSIITSNYRGRITGSAMSTPRENVTVLEAPITLIPLSKLGGTSAVDYANRRNNRKLGSVIKWTLEHLGYYEYVLVVDALSRGTSDLPDILGQKLSVYYRSSFEVNRIHRFEAALAARCDMVITASVKSADTLRHYNINTYAIGLGIDYSDINDLQGKVVTQSHRQSICCLTPMHRSTASADLLLMVAQRIPDATITIIGSPDEESMAHPLFKLSAVEAVRGTTPWFVSKTIAESDVCVNPELCSVGAYTTCYQRIAFALMNRKAVVSTPSRNGRIFAQYISAADSFGDFVAKTRSALSHAPNATSTEYGRRFAESLGWKNCTEKFSRCINETLARIGKMACELKKTL